MADSFARSVGTGSPARGNSSATCGEPNCIAFRCPKRGSRVVCLGRTQIYELIARYRKRPHTSTLLRGKRGRRTRSRFLKPAIEEIVNDVVKKFFPTRERPRVSDLLQFINVACDEQGLPTPNYRTVRRRLRTLDPKLVASKRLGAKAAREIFAPVHASSAGLLLPLDVVQIDHTPADVIVVDEHDRQPIGRPWLTQ